MLCTWRHSVVPCGKGAHGSREKSIEDEVAMSDRLPIGILLGTDVSQLPEL